MSDNHHDAGLTHEGTPEQSHGSAHNEQLKRTAAPEDSQARQSGPSPAGPGQTDAHSPSSAAKKRRRGSRGGRNRPRPAAAQTSADASLNAADRPVPDRPVSESSMRERPKPASSNASDVELPERMSEGRPSPEAAAEALVTRPKIGDTRPAPAPVKPSVTMPGGVRAGSAKPVGRRKPRPDQDAQQQSEDVKDDGTATKKKRRRGSRTKGAGDGRAAEGDVIERRRGRERNGKPIGRYFMCVQVRPNMTQVAVLEGRSLIEHYVSRPADDISQIHGNIYVGRVQNVLPGMEAAFVDIATPKNAVLYRGDVQYDAEDIVDSQPRIEQILKSRQLIVCQVTKNPIGVKGARLTQEVSLPGRFVVLIPNSKTYGISKRLPDNERKRLRAILDRVKPEQHGLIVRTAAESATEQELQADMSRLLDQWAVIEERASKASGPTLLYREPPLAVRVIREEFNADYRGVVIDDRQLFEDVHSYVSAFNPELADRVEFFDRDEEGLPILEKHHVHEQIHKALDRKVWLPSGGSLIIEHTEALTVIDVNTGRNVGSSNLEQTVFQNNLEAAQEVARQLRLRDIGGIIVIDFIDMEIKENRKKVVEAFKGALSRDKTRTQVFEISELGLVEMTRKRIGEGLLTSYAGQCPECQGRGVLVDHSLLL